MTETLHEDLGQPRVADRPTTTSTEYIHDIITNRIRTQYYIPLNRTTLLSMFILNKWATLRVKKQQEILLKTICHNSFRKH